MKDVPRLPQFMGLVGLERERTRLLYELEIAKLAIAATEARLDTVDQLIQERTIDE